MKLLFIIISLCAIAGLCVWIVGARQPSQAIYRFETVIFLALKQGNPGHPGTGGSLGETALWRGSVVYPLVGETYWTDYAILPPDPAALAEVKDNGVFDDMYAAELKLTRVPVFALGILRTLHKLGFSRRPGGALPESMDEIGGRKELLPNEDALHASEAAPSDMPVTMINYLAYLPAEDGDKAAGRRTYNKYGRVAMQAVHGVGGQFLFAGQIKNVLVESKNTEGPGQWDDLAAMVYPDPMAIFYMEQNEAYTRALGYRDKGLERTIVTATRAY